MDEVDENDFEQVKEKTDKSKSKKRKKPSVEKDQESEEEQPQKKSKASKKGKKTKAKKKKKEEEEEVEHDEQEELQVEGEERGKKNANIKLTKSQKLINEALKLLDAFLVGQVNIDPKLLLPPPKKFASRSLYLQHVEKLARHMLETLNMLMPKAMMLSVKMYDSVFFISLIFW